MKSLLLALLCLLQVTIAFRFVSKVEELPVELTDRLEIIRPKVRVCGGEDDSEESTDCVLCTVCHPHEYELIGCSGQMDSVCASCTTGWLRSTPKTIDFFRKCKKHPQLPFLFPQVPYGYPLKLDKSSMFADQEKMLHEAENTEIADSEETFSDEEYEDEDEEDEEEAVDDDTGVNPVDVDERDEDSESAEVEKSTQELKFMYDFHHDMERMIAEKFQKKKRTDENEIINVSEEDENSMELKDEERADPFDEKTEKSEEEEEEDDLEYRIYPLHKVNIWRIVGPEVMKIDDKGLTDEVREAISARRDEWRMERGLNGMARPKRIRNWNNEAAPDTLDTNEKTSDLARSSRYGWDMTQAELFAWAFCLIMIPVSILIALKICCGRRRNRVIVLPELDEISRQLINEAHARIHAKKGKKSVPEPEFV